MNVDVYGTYSFDFNPTDYVRNFKQALDRAGIKKPAQFHRLLKNAGIKGYDIETVKSYFYGRRMPHLNVFIAVCKSLHLCADEIAFPNSILSPAYGGDISDCEVFFRNVFCPYNPPAHEGDPVDLTAFFSADTYQSDVHTLGLILTKYNYLIQKYHAASVSNDELAQITAFTEKYIMDRESNRTADAQQVLEWIRRCEDEAFLSAFYSKYTLGFYNKRCYSLLVTLSTAIPDRQIREARKLLPLRDLTQEGEI